MNRRLTDDRFVDRVPRWTGDSTRMVFHSNRSGEYKVWSIDVDGEGLRRLETTSGGDLSGAIAGEIRNCLHRVRPAVVPVASAAWVPGIRRGRDAAPVSERGDHAAVLVGGRSTDCRMVGQPDGRVGALFLYDLAARTFERLDVGVRNAALPTFFRRDQLVFGDEHRAYSMDLRTRAVTEL